MIKRKRGNIISILLPIMFIIFIAIIVVTIFLFFQISIFLYDVKLNTFYIVQSSLSKGDYNNIVYGDYTLDEKTLKGNINNLYAKNYLVNKNKTKGIVNIECYEAKIIERISKVRSHTNKRYNVPVICVKYKIDFIPLITLLKDEIEIKMHDDIKLSLLEFK